MGNHTKENKNKKKQLKLDSAKTSFVAGIIVFITIFKDLLEYLESELPLWLNGVYASVCLILVVLAFGTKILDKPLRKKETVESCADKTTKSTILTMLSMILLFLCFGIFPPPLYRYLICCFIPFSFTDRQ